MWLCAWLAGCNLLKVEGPKCSNPNFFGKFNSRDLFIADVINRPKLKVVKQLFKILLSLVDSTVNEFYQECRARWKDHCCCCFQPLELLVIQETPINKYCRGEWGCIFFICLWILSWRHGGMNGPLLSGQICLYSNFGVISRLPITKHLEPCKKTRTSQDLQGTLEKTASILPRPPTVNTLNTKVVGGFRKLNCRHFLKT